MVNVKFLHQPGYIYDLITIFRLHFNKSAKRAFPDVEQYNIITQEFSGIDDDLLIFFFMKDDALCLLSNILLDDIDQKPIQTYDFEQLRDKLSDLDSIKASMIKFYLPHIDNTEDVNINIFHDFIMNSSYPDSVKLRLLTFFIKPQKYIQKLIYQLCETNMVLKKYYEKNYKTILNVQNDFSMVSFLDNMNAIQGKNFSYNENETQYFSVCLLAKETIYSRLSKNITVIGADYKKTLEMLIYQKNEPVLEEFGKTLGDKCRISILQMLNVTEELSTSDIAKNLAVSVNAAFYHLNMMQQNNLLLTRSEGRTVYYRINRYFFINASKSLLKYANQNDKGSDK